MEDYLKGLNESQFEAVTTLQGPLMVLAGAGSGKTRVLTMRIAHLITNGIDPSISSRSPLPIRQQKK